MPSVDKASRVAAKPEGAGTEGADGDVPNSAITDASDRLSGMLSRHADPKHDDADGKRPQNEQPGRSHEKSKVESSPPTASKAATAVPAHLQKSERLRGPAEAPFARRPHDDSTDDAERLAAGGALSTPASTTQPHSDAPLGVGATSAAAQSPDVDIITELADRILVAEHQPGQNEVRIRLNIDTLQGAEITLNNTEGGLSIAFETPSSDIAGRLGVARPGLIERLQEKTGLNVTVEISHAEDAKSGDGERNDGRSRNRLDYEPDSGGNA